MGDKSFIARLEERILKSTKPDYMDSQDKIDDFLSNRQSGDAPVKSIFKSVEINGTQVFTFGKEDARNTILFIHGGAYINEINYQHLLYCFLLARKLNAYVLAPVYPLAPKHTATETFDMMSELYGEIIPRDNLILMGDSAGGGFTHSFCQYLKTIGLPQPKQIITFSPWVDISMDDVPYGSEDDPILGEIGLREIGKSWAGELIVKDYRVSPLYGDNAGLPKTLIFAGTGEIFHKDIIKYVDNLKRDGVDVRLIEGNGLFHIYPMFPMPEARKAFKEIKKEING